MGGLFENSNQQSKLNIKKNVVNIISAIFGIIWVAIMFLIAFFAMEPTTNWLALMILGIIGWAFLVLISIKICMNFGSKILKR